MVQATQEWTEDDHVVENSHQPLWLSHGVSEQPSCLLFHLFLIDSFAFISAG